MKISTPTLFVLSLACCLSPAAFGQSPPPNAGTGPYDLIGQPPGSGYTGPGFDRWQDFLASFRRVIVLLNSRDVEAINREISKLVALSTQGAQISPQIFGLTEVREKLKTFRPGIAQVDLDRLIEYLTGEFRSRSEKIWEEQREPSHYELGNTKIGLYSRSSTTYEFQSLLYSPTESGERLRIAPFFSAGALYAVTNPSSPSTASVGGGVVFGSPGQWVGSASLSSFLSPYALDLVASLTYNLHGYERRFAKEIPETADPLEFLDENVPAKMNAPTLLDRIRPGDLWIAATARSISGSKSSRVVNGEIFEGSATFGFRDVMGQKSPKLATTFTFSGSFSGRRELGVNELGFHLRSPVFGRGVLDDPVLFGVRYGTRGTWTFALETRF